MSVDQKAVLKEANRYCRWLTDRSGSHFPLSFRLLPPSRRQAMEAVYAYCRAVDDVADDGARGGARGAREELLRWRGEVQRMVRGYPIHPIAVALQPVLERHRIPAEYLEKLIRGVEMDLDPRPFQGFSQLRVYCEHVASVVGLISVRVFGCQNPQADRYARTLGIALQLTNILRDLKADAARGRCYLPQEDLKRFGFSQEEIAEGKRTELFFRMMAFECERAKDYFRQAGEALEESGQARRLLPARIMGRIYRRLLARIEAAHYDVFSSRISVPRWEQMWIALTCLVWR